MSYDFVYKFKKEKKKLYSLIQFQLTMYYFYDKYFSSHINSEL